MKVLKNPFHGDFQYTQSKVGFRFRSCPQA